MKSLVLVLLACSVLSLSEASCYQKAYTREQEAMTHCQDDKDKTWHPVGSSWRNSDCMDCTCSGCCTSYTTPTNFPPDCVKVFDSEKCEYIVHQRDDPTVLCPIYGGVGK